jgi:hypothetical protein
MTHLANNTKGLYIDRIHHIPLLRNYFSIFRLLFTLCNMLLSCPPDATQSYEARWKFTHLSAKKNISTVHFSLKLITKSKF